MRYRVTSSRLGTYNPCISEDRVTIYYDDQTRDGRAIVSIPFKPSDWKQYQPRRQASLFFRHLVEQEGHPDIFRAVPSLVYPHARYRKVSGFINPYNWGVTVDSDLAEASVGILSRDILSTISVGLGYYFDINERTSALRGHVSYQGWYPIIDISASISGRSVNEGGAIFYDTLVDPHTAEQRDVIFKWREKNVQAGVRIPLLTT